MNATSQWRGDRRDGKYQRPRIVVSVSIFMTTPSTMAKASRSPLPSGVKVLGEITLAFSEILTPEALAFVAKLQRQFGARRT
jgi:malate synthase-like protein